MKKSCIATVGLLKSWCCGDGFASPHHAVSATSLRTVMFHSLLLGWGCWVCCVAEKSLSILRAPPLALNFITVWVSIHCCACPPSVDAFHSHTPAFSLVTLSLSLLAIAGVLNTDHVDAHPSVHDASVLLGFGGWLVFDDSGVRCDSHTSTLSCSACKCFFFVRLLADDLLPLFTFTSRRTHHACSSSWFPCASSKMPSFPSCGAFAELLSDVFR